MGLWEIIFVLPEFRRSVLKVVYLRFKIFSK